MLWQASIKQRTVERVKILLAELESCTFHQKNTPLSLRYLISNLAKSSLKVCALKHRPSLITWGLSMQYSLLPKNIHDDRKTLLTEKVQDLRNAIMSESI